MKKFLVTLLVAGLSCATVALNHNYKTTLEITTETYEGEIASLERSVATLEEEKANLHSELSAADALLEDTVAAYMSLDDGYSSGVFKLTAYSPFDDVSGIESDGNPDVTSIGMTPGPHVIAVDPTVIPYYSNILVIYEDGSYLFGVAGDTGGAIKGNRLDIYKDTYKEACDFGVQHANVIWW